MRVLIFIMGLVSLAWVFTEWRLERSWPVSAVEILRSTNRDTADAIERGQHLAENVAVCGHCHGADLGGAVVSDSWLLGRLWAPNLTGETTPVEFVASLRQGLEPDGSTLVAMPSEHLRALSDGDLADIRAYLGSLARVERRSPSRTIGPIARLGILLGRGSDIVTAERVAELGPLPHPPEPGPTAEYGAHLARIGLCHLCHHEDLSGGLHPLALPGEPVPADLRLAGPLSAWTESDFRTAMRAGLTPEGRALDSAWMPWPRYAAMSDQELAALWAFLQPRSDD